MRTKTNKKPENTPYMGELPKWITIVGIINTILVLVLIIFILRTLR